MTATLILIMDMNPCPASKQAMQRLCRYLAHFPVPTFALGLTHDVTLALTGPWPEIIYNAYEFLSVTDEASHTICPFNQVFTVLNGHVWPAVPEISIETLMKPKEEQPIVPAKCQSL